MDNGGKRMIENATQDVAAESMPTRKDLLGKAMTAETPSSEPKKVPPGHVVRTLNFRDRNMLIGACRDYCQRDDKKKHKDRENLDRVSKALCFEETIDYFLMIQDDIDEKVAVWQGARERYRLWRQYRENLLKPEDVEEFKSRYPKMDLEKGPEKPGPRAPEIDPKENRGPEREFHLPAKLDVWVQEVLRATDWNTPPAMAEFVVELCARFDIKNE